MTKKPTILLENRFFLVILAALSLLFLALIKPFWFSIFWAFVLALLFYPLQKRLMARFPNHPNSMTFITIVSCLLIVILPAFILASSLVNEAQKLYVLIQQSELNPIQYLIHMASTLPFADKITQHFNINLNSIQSNLSQIALSSSKSIAGQTLNIGQNTLSFLLNFFVMLYVLFFLLRDHAQLGLLLFKALPLGTKRKQMVFDKSIEVIRATVKGNVLVAIIQGSLGGVIFAILGLPSPILWGVVMAFLSMIPMVGAGLIWAPAAIVLAIQGQWLDAAILTFFGMAVIGSIDNILRPIFVGRDTKLPDYVVLISTLGGFSLFGISGFILGPLVAALFMSFWAIFIQEFSPKISETN